MLDMDVEARKREEEIKQVYRETIKELNTENERLTFELNEISVKHAMAMVALKKIAYQSIVTPESGPSVMIAVKALDEIKAGRPVDEWTQTLREDAENP